jgi:nicotinate-nucleotide pyrophosphorylase (carboxylating)
VTENLEMNSTRDKRIEAALFLGGELTLENPAYRETVRGLNEILVRDDMAPTDLTVKALGLAEHSVKGLVIGQEGGVVAGLGEFAFLLREHRIDVSLEKRDGDVVRSGDVLARAEGPETKLLALERVPLNLLQRMSGIATAGRCLQQRVARNSGSRVIGTRKTPWGLLDKRALHLGGVGTHRLGLGDAILIKNNHLALLGANEEAAAPVAIERAWTARREAGFIEIEVRGEEVARLAAETFRRLREEDSDEYPCLLLLDNIVPDQISGIIRMLQEENLWDHVLIEASGGISEANIEAYAGTGVDAISMGALTHSVRALDICLRIEPPKGNDHVECGHASQFR